MLLDLKTDYSDLIKFGDIDVGNYVYTYTKEEIFLIWVFVAQGASESLCVAATEYTNYHIGG